MPDVVALLSAAETLVEQGSRVLPYTAEDPAAAQRLPDLGSVGDARSFREAGAYGVAVMGSLMTADDPCAMTEALLAEVNR